MRTMAYPHDIAPQVIQLLAAVVDSGGEAMAVHLAETCGLTKAQLQRQLKWMEKQDLVNQVHRGDGRTWVRATASGREVLRRALLEK